MDVIARNRPAEVSAHFARLARLRVRISDFEALTFGAIDLFVLGMLAAGLVRSCALPDASAGEIYALFRYLLMFAYGLESVPLLVQQGCRLHDIGARLRDGGGAAPDAG